MKANAPEKIYFDGESKACKLPIFSSQNIEYIRTDAFINKATLWLTENASDYCILHNSYDTKELVEDFIAAMKGEQDE